jgi:serine phosphatase RsbU (regulator of sigma subunit)/anti-sigma regulatory factor (Ser/Thr protein kinase)
MKAIATRQRVADARSRLVQWSTAMGDRPMAMRIGRSLLVLSVLFLAAILVTRALQDRLSRHLVEKVVSGQRMRVSWNVERFDATLRRAEASVQRFASLISYNTVDLEESGDSLFSLVSRDRDGAWRTPRATFDAATQAGIWIPPSVPLNDETRRFFVRSQRITTLFGLGASDDLVGNTWVLPLTNGEVVFWPGDPYFIYNAAANLDYRDTPWVQLTSPRSNRHGRPRWTDPSYDPAARDWLISVVAPFRANGRWAGSVGHDIRLRDLLRSLIEDAATPMALRQGSSGADAPLFVVRDDGQLLARRGSTPSSGERLPAHLIPFLKNSRSSSGIRTFNDGLNYVIVAPLPALNARVIYLVQGKWIRNTLQEELFGLQLVQALVIAVLLGSGLALALRDAQYRRRQQELLESRNRDLEQLVKERTQELEQAGERLKKEVLQASHIQRDLLASERELLALVPELEVGALMVPSKEVGGDLYDCIPVSGHRMLICVGDVAGKGMPAALMMSTCLSLLRAYGEILDSPAAILRRLNQRLCHNNETCAFTTLVVAILDPRSGEIRYCNAGHNPMLIQRENGVLEILSTVHGPALGVDTDQDYGETRVTLQANDTLVAYTDGAIETFSAEKERYGLKRLAAFLQSVETRRCSRLVRAIMRDLRQFAQGEYQHDDITLIALRRRMRPEQASPLYGEKAFTIPETASAGVSSNRSAIPQPLAGLDLPVANAIEAMADIKHEVEGFCEARGIDRPVRRRLMVVIDELLNNVIRHGCSHLGSKARINLELKHWPQRLELEIRDNGWPPFNPLEAESPDVQGSLEERVIGGLGIHLVRQLGSDFSYRQTMGLNVLNLSIPLSQAPAAG